MSGWRAVIEKMAKVRSATRTFYLVPYHSMTSVAGVGYFACGQRRIETWPASVGFKFRVGAEQLNAARGAEINSFFVIVPIQILVGRLCFRFAQDLKLAGSQDLSPLVIAQCHLLGHRSGIDLAPDSSDLDIVRQTEMNGQNKEQKQGQRFHYLAAFASTVSSDRVS